MRFEPIEIKDKADRTIVLRNALPEDAEELIRLLKTAAGETRYLLREPDEITMTREQEETFVKHCLDSERSLMVVALLDGQLVGNCSVNPVGDYKRYFHRCEVALAIYREFWGCGIGRQMLESVLGAAKETGFEQAELEVISGNERAIALYEKLGFQKYGSFPDHMKYADGSYASADWMMKKLLNA